MGETGQQQLEVVIPESTEIVVPAIGEVVNLDDPQSCAYALAAIRDLKYQLDGARARVERALVEHSQAAGTKTMHLDGITAKVSGGNELQWDMEELAKLQDAGLPEARYDELVKIDVRYKVNAAVAKSIEGSNPEYGRIIGNARTYIEKPWRVSVE